MSTENKPILDVEDIRIDSSHNGDSNHDAALTSDNTVEEDKDLGRQATGEEPGRTIGDNQEAMQMDKKESNAEGSELQCVGKEIISVKPQMESSLPIFTTKRDEAVRLKISENGSEDAPITVMSLFEKTVQKFPNYPALREQRDSEWVTWTYSEYQLDVLVAAKAFIKLGLEPYKGVGIIGFNSPEWMISDLGAVYACGLATGIYTTNTAEACLFVASDAQINILVAENDTQVQKFIGIWDKLPCLKAIVQYKGELKQKQDNIYTWNEFMELGRQSDNTELKERMAMQLPNKCCTLIYTSGTTGNPKGVMLSHDNITFSAGLLVIAVGYYMEQQQDRAVVSYLPLSHIAAQIVDIYGSIAFAATVSYARPDALKGSLGATLKAVRPTLFLGVPRVFEKIQERMKQIGETITGVKKKIGTWAKDVALKTNMNKENGQSASFGFTVASMFLKKVRVQLGLDRCKMIFTGAAPISLETLRYFQSINVPLLELYGMSECTGCATLSLPQMVRTSSVGKKLSHVDVSILNQDEDGSGEICMRGRFVFMGYLENVEKTQECVDDQGWLHSGDVGKFDEEGFLYITGRIKELIITAGGENIAPVPIEDHIKAQLPFISNAMAIGDKRKFLAVILTPKIEMDPDTGAPMSELSTLTKSYCQKLGMAVTSVAEIAPSVPEPLDKAIKEGIERANGLAVSRAAKVQKYVLLPTDFSIAGGELGPTLKLRRPQVNKIHMETIECIYA